MSQPTSLPKSTAMQAKDIWKNLTAEQKVKAQQTLVQICQNLTQKIAAGEAKHEHNHSACK